MKKIILNTMIIFNIMMCGKMYAQENVLRKNAKDINAICPVIISVGQSIKKVTYQNRIWTYHYYLQDINSFNSFKNYTPDEKRSLFEHSFDAEPSFWECIVKAEASVQYEYNYENQSVTFSFPANQVNLNISYSA